MPEASSSAARLLATSRVSKKSKQCRGDRHASHATTWRMLLETGWHPPKHLKILCGGEALTRELATQLLKNASLLWNMYGPTETTIWSTAFQVSSGDEVVSLGRPIDNTQVYLLDKHRIQFQIGVSGRDVHWGDGLCVAIGIGRTSFRRSSLIIPSGGDRKSLLYRTGDLARDSPYGNIEIFGPYRPSGQDKEFSHRARRNRSDLSMTPVSERSGYTSSRR